MKLMYNLNCQKHKINAMGTFFSTRAICVESGQPLWKSLSNKWQNSAESL